MRRTPACPARVFGAVVVVAAAVAALLRLPSSWVESRYSRSIYPVLQRHLTSWSNRVPFAVSDLLLLAALGVVAWELFRLTCDRAREGWMGPARRLAAKTTVAAAVVYLAFLATWGLNYQREPLRHRLDFSPARVTSEAAVRMARRTVGRLNDLHPRAHAQGWPEWEALDRLLGPAFERVQRQLADVSPAVPGLPKRSLAAGYLRRAGISGVTDPFVLEVIPDRSLLPFERPFVVAHEWAHLAGYADEAEANVIGWLVCLQGPPAAEYSGDLALLVDLVPTLGRDDRRAVIAALGPGPRRDLREMAARAASAWPWLQRPAWWVYDRYLRANRVEQGTRSYGAAVELLLGTRFQDGWVPALREP